MSLKCSEQIGQVHNIDGTGLLFTFLILRVVAEQWDSAEMSKLKAGVAPSRVSISDPIVYANPRRRFNHEENEGRFFLVLSVDDDPINQMVIENLLVPEGFKVGVGNV